MKISNDDIIREALVYNQTLKEQIGYPDVNIINAFIDGAKWAFNFSEQNERTKETVDTEKYNTLRKLAYNMYTSMQYLTTDTSGIRKAMEEFHHFICFEG